MITVLHVITSLGTGGAETMLAKLVARSDRGRFRHVVVSLMDQVALGTRFAALGVPVHTLGMRRGRPDPRGAVRLLRLTRRLAPDVVQTWLLHADLLGTPAALVARAPLVWNIRSSFHYGLGSLPSRACAWLSRVPAAVVVNSEAGRAVHAGVGYRPRQWRLIPNGFDLDEFRPDPGARAVVRAELDLPGDAPLVGLVGLFDPLKDHRTFLQAASLLHRREPGVHFVLVGRDVTPANASLGRLVAAGELEGHAHLLGERHDLARLTAALDVATSSSLAESFPSVVGEAMACAVPCVVTDVGDSATIVGDTGRVVPPRDPVALAAAWEEMVRLGPEERAALGRRARARVEARYAIDHVVRQYEELYAELAS